MTRRRHRWDLAAVVVAILILATVVSPLSHADQLPGDSELEITSLTPEQYRTGDDLKIRARTDLPSGSDWYLETFLQPIPFDSVWEMDAFLEGDGFPGWRIDVRETTVPRTGSLRWTIEDEQMPWPDTQTTGARGLTVRLSNQDQVVESRSVLIYEPLEQLPQTKVNVLLFAELDADADAVKALATLPGITVAAPGRSADYGATESGTGSGTGSVAEPEPALDQTGVEILPLPQAGSDASSLADADLPLLLELSLSSRGGAQGYEKAQVVEDVVVASDEGFTLQALERLHGNAIIAPRSWGNDIGWESSVTATSLVYLPSGQGLAPVVDDWAPGSDLLSRPVGSDGEELILRQSARAMTMLVGLQDPSDQRTLFIRQAEDVDLEEPAVRKRLEAVLGTDWILPVQLSDVLASEPSEVPRPPIPASGSSLADYKEQLLPLEDELSLATRVASATELGENLLLPYTRGVLAPTASTLSSIDRKRLTSAALKDLKEVSRAVKVLPLSTVNMLHQDANFPISVANQGASDVSVRVLLEPSDARLQPREDVSAEIAAGGQVEVTIPVRAVGAGDVTVRVVVTAPSGEVIDSSQEVVVRVRPNWEDIGTIAFAGAVVALFLIGIFRSFRSGRRRSQEPTARPAKRTQPRNRLG